MGQSICNVHGGGDQAEANARLIAAAPEMLAALEAWANFEDPEGLYEDAVWAHEKQMLAAIAKAKGETASE